MRASALLKEARANAGLSQREVARRSGLPQASLSRIERGVVSPTVATLDRLLGACGFEVEAVPRPGRGVDRTLIRDRLRLTPSERIRRGELEWEEVDAFGQAARAGRRTRRTRPRRPPHAGAA